MVLELDEVGLGVVIKLDEVGLMLKLDEMEREIVPDRDEGGGRWCWSWTRWRGR